MAENRDPNQWVETRQRVEARYASHDGAGVHAVGEVTGYANFPTVIIETDRGEQISWAAHLTYPVSDPCGEPTDALVRQARCTKPANHYGERHTADIGGGTYTWGHLPHPEDAR